MDRHRDLTLKKFFFLVNQVQNSTAQSFFIVLKIIKLINSANNLKVLKLLDDDQDLSRHSSRLLFMRSSKKLINYIMIEGQWGEM
ncbi:hypothetical protein BpHYR1_005109 [Brachionus plicatilis]|uniref:Uncharacterized protein n=1 Tax=Brachionus plicatilis TaxID=10195 RepID=A0A3M7RKC9_BRAPC|nr:hypothetical protein BpHYR1_005109 [Brachionus plicatilis]